MATGIELATAYISVVPDMSRVPDEVKRSFKGLDSTASKAGQSMGGRITSGVGKVMKGAALGGITAAGAVLAKALWGGFNRLQGIESAEAKLAGLGHSTKAVAGIMDDATAAVKGTAFGLDEAATVAASSVAAGIKPGKELEANLRLVADAATIAGTDMGSMGQIFNKVATTNKLQGEVIQQLGERGIPIIQLVAKEMGVSAGKVSELAAKGKIDFATFSAAMKSGMGGAALESGKTFKGSLANMNAALSRFGAAVLGPVFERMPAAFARITEAIDGVGPSAEKIGGRIGNAFIGVIDTVGRVVSAIRGFASTDLFRGLADSVAGFGSSVAAAFATLRPAISALVRDLAPILGAALAAGVVAITVAFRALGPVIQFAASAIAAVVSVLTNPIFQITAAVIGGLLVAAYAGAIAAMIRFNAQMAVLIARTAVANAATRAWAVVTRVAAVAGKVFSVAARLVGVALRFALGPIGLVITAIGLLVAAFVWAYRNSATFRKIVNGAFQAVKTVVSATTNAVRAVVTGAWGKIRGAVSGAASGVRKAVSAAWTAVKTATSSLWSSVAGIVRSGVGKVVSTISGLPSKITALGSKMLAAGKSLISNIFDGIRSAASSVGGLASDIASSIKSAINSALRLPFTIKGPGPLPDFTIPAFATGGRVEGATIAMIGEGREAETVFPDSTLGGFLERMTDAATANLGAGAPMGRRMALVLADGTQLDAYVDELIGARDDLVGARGRARR